MLENEASETIQPRREISTQEASQISGLSLNHLAYLLRQGKLEGRRFGDRTWVVYEDSLKSYLAAPHKPGRPKKQKNTVKKPREKSEHQTYYINPEEQIKYPASESRIVVGQGHGERLQVGLSSTSLYSMASSDALRLMQEAEIERFAVDDCIILRNSGDFAGWDADEMQITVLGRSIPIPADLEEIRQAKIPEIEKYYFNPSHYQLVSFTPSFADFGRLDIVLAPLRFYDYYSLTPFLDKPLLKGLDGSKISIRQKYARAALTYSSNDRETGIIPAPVSLQCVVISSDQQIILMERSSSVAYYPNHWSVSFEENMAAPGVDWRGGSVKSNDANFVAGAMRGLETEFAMPKEAIESVKILSLNIEYLTLSVDVIILIKVNLGSEEVKQRWMVEARDKDEASRFASISTDLHEVVDKLFSKTLWHPTSRMRLIQFLFHTYGVKEVAKAIQRREAK